MAMTNEQKKSISFLAHRYMAIQTQCYVYNWGSDLNGKSAFSSWVKEMKELNINFNDLSETDALLLGMSKNKNTKNEDIYLVPIHLFSILPVGTYLYGLFEDKKYIIGEDNLSNDTRGGYVAYGIKVTS